MLTESRFVPTDTAGPFRYGTPEVGDFVLIGNAGGAHQSPGRYGYTRTEVLNVDTRGLVYPGGRRSRRIETRTFGWSCWEIGGNGSRICIP